MVDDPARTVRDYIMDNFPNYDMQQAFPTGDEVLEVLNEISPDLRDEAFDGLMGRLRSYKEKGITPNKSGIVGFFDSYLLGKPAEDSSSKRNVRDSGPSSLIGKNALSDSAPSNESYEQRMQRLTTEMEEAARRNRSSKGPGLIG